MKVRQVKNKQKQVTLKEIIQVSKVQTPSTIIPSQISVEPTVSSLMEEVQGEINIERLSPFPHTPKDTFSNLNNIDIGEIQYDANAFCDEEACEVTIDNNVPAIIPRSYPKRIRSPPAKFNPESVTTNPFEGKDYETINCMLHHSYGYVHDEEYTGKKFNVDHAENDLHYLQRIQMGSLEEDPDNFLLGLWMTKIKSLITAHEKRNDNSDSENETEYE